MVPCSYCGNDTCNDCPLPFDDAVEFCVCLDKGEKLLQPEVHIVWKVPFRYNGKVDDTYDDWKRHYLIAGSNDVIDDNSNTTPTAVLFNTNGAIPLPASNSSPIPAYSSSP